MVIWPDAVGFGAGGHRSSPTSIPVRCLDPRTGTPLGSTALSLWSTTAATGRDGFWRRRAVMASVIEDVSHGALPRKDVRRWEM
jgi:hypothetical protein